MRFCERKPLDCFEVQTAAGFKKNCKLFIIHWLTLFKRSARVF